MRLKEKILKNVNVLPLKQNFNKGEINNFNLCVNKLEKTADDYAIEFAEWFVLRYTEAVFYRKNYTEDLLEEFKRETEKI